MVCLALAIPAFVHSSAPLTLAAIIAYSAGDVADGQTARRLRQETRRGAVFDIVADRVSGVAVILALTEVRPSMAAPSCYSSCSSTCWTASSVSDSCTGRS